MTLSAQEELTLLRKRARRRLVGAVVLVVVAVVVLWNVIARLPDQPIQPETVEIVQPDAPPSDHAAVAENPPTEEHNASAPGAQVAFAKENTTPLEPQGSEKTEIVANLASVTASAPAAEPKATETAPTPKPVMEPKPIVEPHKPSVETKPKKPLPEAMPKPKTKPAVDPAAILEGRLDPTEGGVSKPADSSAKETRYVIQLAALKDEQKANELKGRLHTLGVPVHIARVRSASGDVFRVRAGSFNQRADAEKQMQKLFRLGINGLVVPVKAQ